MVFIHKYASILSAVGMGVADVVHEEQCPFKGNLSENTAQAIALLDDLETKARHALHLEV